MNIAVRYVGNKPIKKDTVTGSLAVWVGKNSVCEAPQEVATRLFLYPTVWAPADAPLIERPAPVAAQEAPTEDHDGELLLDEPYEEVRPDDEHGFETPPEAVGPVTVDEVVPILSLLDREKEFTEGGKPSVGAVRDRFPGRDLTVATVREAWARFTGE